MSRSEANLEDLTESSPLNPIIPLRVLNEMPLRPEHDRTNDWQSPFHIGCKSPSNIVFMPLIRPKPGFKHHLRSSSVVRRRPILQSPFKTKIHHCCGETSRIPHTYPHQTTVPGLQRWNIYVHGFRKLIQLTQKLRHGGPGDLRGRRS